MRHPSTSLSPACGYIERACERYCVGGVATIPNICRLGNHTSRSYFWGVRTSARHTQGSPYIFGYGARTALATAFTLPVSVWHICNHTANENINIIHIISNTLRSSYCFVGKVASDRERAVYAYLPVSASIMRKIGHIGCGGCRTSRGGYASIYIGLPIV